MSRPPKVNCSRLVSHMVEEIPTDKIPSFGNGLPQLATWGIIFCGLLSIISAFICLCRRNNGFGAHLTDEEWEQALAERMQDTLASRINVAGSQLPLKRLRRHRIWRRDHIENEDDEKCMDELGEFPKIHEYSQSKVDNEGKIEATVVTTVTVERCEGEGAPTDSKEIRGTNNDKDTV